jgi:hypothetical protein
VPEPSRLIPNSLADGHHGERLCAGEAYNRLPTLSVSLISAQSIEILQVPKCFPVLRFWCQRGPDQRR